MNPEKFRQALAERGWTVSDHQMRQFDTYYKRLVETNEHVNLTAITDEKEVYLKHFYDSVTPLLEAPQFLLRESRYATWAQGQVSHRCQ